MDNIPRTAEEYRAWWEANTDEPFGLCWCGCKRETNLVTQTERRKGRLKNQPNRFVHNHHTRLSGVEYVVEDRGHDTPCWIWQLGWVSQRSHPYGSKNLGNRQSQLAHHYYYEQRYGPVPDELQLDHLCRNTLCCNPDHLEPVTASVNVRRGLLGKLTEEQVEEIRRSYVPSYGEQVKFARYYGVKPCTIRYIHQGRKR